MIARIVLAAVLVGTVVAKATSSGSDGPRLPPWMVALCVAECGAAILLLTSRARVGAAFACIPGFAGALRSLIFHSPCGCLGSGVALSPLGEAALALATAALGTLVLAGFKASMGSSTTG